MTDSDRGTVVDSGTDDAGDVAGTDAYEVDDGDGVVVFDVNNPLAWVEADDAVALSRMA